MYCPECGDKNSEDAIFCQNCGLNLKKSTTHDPHMSSAPIYQPPINEESSSGHHSPSPILDDLEDLSISEFRDTLSPSYYLLSFLFWPVGIFLWAFYRDRKPQSASNLLLSSLAGFAIVLLILLV